MGEMQVPDSALYGASTQRAVLNFPVSGRGMPADFIQALGLLKWACVSANEELGRISSEKAELIRKAAEPPPPPRKKTKPTYASKLKRLEGKAKRGSVKAMRGRPRGED